MRMSLHNLTIILLNIWENTFFSFPHSNLYQTKHLILIRMQIHLIDYIIRIIVQGLRNQNPVNRK
jgi:hypothetical protein